jgi:hypothetical protein
LGHDLREDNGGMGRQVGFVGRRQELGRLEAALARAVDGQPAVVLIGGEAGSARPGWSPS